MNKFTSPIYIILPRKTKKDKKISLNLNTYRNLNFMVNNNVKQKYNKLMLEQLANILFNHSIFINYTLYMPTTRKCDVSNICCIVDKFFCDAMVYYKVIDDDNYDWIKGVSYHWGGISKDNPRVDINIHKWIDEDNSLLPF